MSERFFRLSGLVFACAATASLALTGCAHKPAYTTEKDANYFGTGKVHRYRLANGLKVLILEDHSAPTFAYQTWFNVGSRDELPGRTGLAHFFEHLMFKATKNHPDGEFDKLLEGAGAEGENAFTSRDYTGYVESMPKDKLEMIANLESDRMVNLLVQEEPVKSEREVVQNERRFRNENNPNGQLYERVYELSYAKHSYHWPVIGYDVDLRNASVADFEAFYRRYYAPNNATVVVVGDVDPSGVMSLINKYYGSLPSSKIDRHLPPAEPPQTAERVETKEIKTPVEKLVIGYHIPDVNGPDFPALEVAREILAGGKGSRLYRKLVDGGIATTVELESAEHKDPGVMLVFVNLQKGKTARQALEVIDREVHDLASGHVTPEELQRAVAMHRFAVFDDLASNYSKAQFIGFYETIAGNFERGVQIVSQLPSVDKAAVAKAVKDHFGKNNRSVVIGVSAKTEGKGK